MSRPDNSLVLLFTYGISLKIWRRQGLLDRELSYYRQLRAAGCGDVTFITYDPDDAVPQQDVEPFRVAARPRSLGDLAYSLLAPIIRRGAFRRAAIIKSNQSRGAWTGVVAKRLYPHAIFIVRCGWVRTREMMRRDEGRGPFWLWWAELVERITFRAADAIFVVTPSDGAYVEGTYGIPGNRIHVMPNAVDVTLFAPDVEARGPDTARTEVLKIVSVGRVVEMKNFQGLIRAAAGLGRPTAIVVLGDGPYVAPLQALAEDLRVSIEFRRFVPNSAVPGELRSADIFVMPQLYASGMPKVILEAMACGTLTIASDIRPHREVISDGVNGLLCGAEPDSIRAAIERTLALPVVDRARIVSRARQDVLDRYSMAVLAQREMALYRSMLGEESRVVSRIA